MLREQDLRVDVTLHEADVPDSGIVFELGIVALSKDDQSVGYRMITQKEDLELYIAPEDLPEIKAGFGKKSLHLWTIQSAADLSSLSEDAPHRVKTLIFSSHTTNIARALPFHFDGITVYTLTSTHPLNSDEDQLLAKTPHVCAFLDPEKDGKILHTFTTLLASYPNVGNQMNISSSSFKSVFTTKNQRDALIKAGFSFFLQSQTGAFLWDVYVGGKQIQSVYSYFILQNQVSSSIASWLKRGQPYSDDSLLNLKGEVSRDLSRLKSQHIIAGYDVDLQWVADQDPSDKVKGIIRGFHVNFNEQYRIAEVHIMINGEV